MMGGFLRSVKMKQAAPFIKDAACFRFYSDGVVVGDYNAMAWAEFVMSEYVTRQPCLPELPPAS